MDRMIEFVTNQWLLFLAFGVIFSMLVGGPIRQRLHGMKKLTTAELVRKMNQETAILLDIRPVKEFEGGHIQSAINLPFANLGKEVSDVLKKHSGKEVVLVCATGNQSVAAGAMVSKQGFKPVYLLEGGMSTWEGANLPLDKKS